MSNQRQHSRSNVRTLVTVLSDNGRDGKAPRVFKGWTEDISASGMQIVCHEELPDTTIYVRILLPKLEDKIVQCRIVRRGERHEKSLLKNAPTKLVYGVLFESVQPIANFEQMLSPAPAAGASAAAV